MYTPIIEKINSRKIIELSPCDSLSDAVESRRKFIEKFHSDDSYMETLTKNEAIKRLKKQNHPSQIKS